MNSLIVVLCAAIVCFAVVQCDKDAHKAKFQECAKENNVSEEELKALKEKSKSADYVPSKNVKVWIDRIWFTHYSVKYTICYDDNISMQCMQKCIAVKMGMIKDGKLDTEHIKQWAKAKDIDSAKVQAAIDECGPLLKSDSCDDAYKMSKCMHSHHHKK